MVSNTALALALFGAFGRTGPVGQGTGSDLTFDSHQQSGVFVIEGAPSQQMQQAVLALAQAALGVSIWQCMGHGR